MPKTILITGATDGIGLETAKMLVVRGHRVLLHGRNQAKLKTVQAQLTAPGKGQEPEIYLADLSIMSDVEALAKAIAFKHSKLDVLINNAGVYSTSKPITQDGLDVRFVVNA
ncbi:MAG: SDR family NAD(P)-dependent oxidoreductase, partial [Cyanobacteria bacterium J06623_7]